MFTYFRAGDRQKQHLALWHGTTGHLQGRLLHGGALRGRGSTSDDENPDYSGYSTRDSSNAADSDRSLSPAPPPQPPPRSALPPRPAPPRPIPQSRSRPSPATRFPAGDLHVYLYPPDQNGLVNEQRSNRPTADLWAANTSLMYTFRVPNTTATRNIDWLVGLIAGVTNRQRMRRLNFGPLRGATGRLLYDNRPGRMSQAAIRRWRLDLNDPEQRTLHFFMFDMQTLLASRSGQPSQRGSGKRKRKATAGKDWKCKMCTSKNSAELEECEKCEFSRGTKPVHPKKKTKSSSENPNPHSRLLQKPSDRKRQQRPMPILTADEMQEFEEAEQRQRKPMESLYMSSDEEADAMSSDAKHRELVRANEALGTYRAPRICGECASEIPPDAEECEMCAAVSAAAALYHQKQQDPEVSSETEIDSDHPEFEQRRARKPSKYKRKINVL